jgi:hypothetical protein
MLNNIIVILISTTITTMLIMGNNHKIAKALEKQDKHLNEQLTLQTRVLKSHKVIAEKNHKRLLDLEAEKEK